MANCNRYLLFLLIALLLYAWTAIKDKSPVEIVDAEVSGQDNAISSYDLTGHANFLSLPTSLSLASLGNHLSNGSLARGKFLVASRRIRDPRFMETVILLVQHDITGTIGLIVNHPTTVSLSELFPEIKKQNGREHFTYIGGPVSMAQISLLIYFKDKIEGAQQIIDNVFLSSSKATLELLMNNAYREAKFHAYAGYAGWVSGQLEHEVSRGDWHVVHADAATIFNKPPSTIWPDLIQEIEIIRIEL